MSEEEIIQDKYEETIFNFLTNNCSEFDDEHIKQLVDLKVEQYNQLKSQLQQKENIIKEARNLIKKESWFCYKDNEKIIDRTPVNKLLEILGDNDE